MNEAGYDVAAFYGEVVVLAVDVGRDDGREVAAVLVVVAPVHDVDHALGIRIALVGGVRRSAVHLDKPVGRQAASTIWISKADKREQEVIFSHCVLPATDMAAAFAKLADGKPDIGRFG